MTDGSPRKLLLRNHLSPGDIVMLTAAVRDLHHWHPGKFLTDVETSSMALWEANPHVTRLDRSDPALEVIDCHYPLINQSNQRPYHFIHGFGQFLGEKLGVSITPTTFRGEVHLSAQEKSWMSQVAEIVGAEVPFWIIVAGGKMDYTIKWWETRRFQAVVDHFSEKILFVQIGETCHHHPALRGVIDLRGKTDIRQVVRLTHHAQGVLCPVTFLMHLATAVETKPGYPPRRPCVVVAGGREPSHWEAYPHHRYLHTQGALKCCQEGGCWKARTLPIGDGDDKDLPGNLCVDVVGDLPRCMDLINSEDVCRAIDSYFQGGSIKYLDSGEASQVARALAVSSGNEPAGTPRRKAPFHQVEPLLLEVCGLRRSGLHPIMNWLLSHYDGGVTFVNDINHRKTPITPDTLSDLLPCIDRDRRQPLPVSTNDNRKIILVGFEDERLLAVKDWSYPNGTVGRVSLRRRVLVLRDPFNLFASRLHLARKEKGNQFSDELFAPDGNHQPFFPELWKRYAREFLSETKHLGEDLIKINYNRWTSDLDYRKNISAQLGRDFFDDSRDSVPIFGFGSSFDGLQFDQRGSMMQVAARWEGFADDTAFRSLLCDSEILALSNEIFGAVVSEDFQRNLALTGTS